MADNQVIAGVGTVESLLAQLAQTPTSKTGCVGFKGDINAKVCNGGVELSALSTSM